MRRFAAAAIFSLLVFMACGAPAATIEGPVQVGLIAAGKGSEFSISVGPCNSGRCPVVVRQRLGGGWTAGVALRWPAAAVEVSEARPDAAWGAGEPLSPLRANVWLIGTGETAVGIAARAVRTQDGAYALLVHQLIGFDHLSRWHGVLAARSGRLRTVWSMTDGTGRGSTAVAAGPGTGQLTVIRRVADDDPARGDTMSMLRVTFSARRARTATVTGTVPAVLAGGYPSAPAAAAARAADAPCLGGFAVIPAASSGDGAGFVLAAPIVAAPSARLSQGCGAGPSFRVGRVSVAPEARKDG